jgi:hypothetical protein
VVQLIAVLTRPKAFIKPKPNLVLNQKPAAFCCQPGLSTTGSTSEVQTIKCWTSLQLRFGFASNASAMIPAASGADAEVPVCLMVHSLCRSVVALKPQFKTNTHRRYQLTII